MREILFKAKVKEEPSDWVEGYLSKCEREFIISDDNGVGVFIIPDTICQYTGLTDKNGNKIWENDICSTDIKRPYAVVEFRNGCFMYNLNDGEEDYYDIMMPVEPLVDSDKYTEVIGNIFDNPELVERN